MKLRQKMAQTVPSLGTYKRFAVAVRDTTLSKTSYAQHGEDQRALELLAGFDLATGMYFDVGANHPTDISNTYLFYRLGYRGVVIEPNLELVRLFGRFRPRDITLPIGCSDEPRIASFAISKTPVLSSLQTTDAGDVWKHVHVPVMPLDAVVTALDPDWIPFLSVDVEGHAAHVLRGAQSALARTYLACVEANGGREEAEVLSSLDAAGFSIVERRACNVFAVNNDAARFARFRTGRD